MVIRVIDSRRIGKSRRSFGAVERNRTSDLLITNQLLYQLSYNSMRKRQPEIIAETGHARQVSDLATGEERSLNRWIQSRISTPELIDSSHFHH